MIRRTIKSVRDMLTRYEKRTPDVRRWKRSEPVNLDSGKYVLRKCVGREGGSDSMGWLMIPDGQESKGGKRKR